MRVLPSNPAAGDVIAGGLVEIDPLGKRPLAQLVRVQRDPDRGHRRTDHSQAQHGNDVTVSADDHAGPAVHRLDGQAEVRLTRQQIGDEAGHLAAAPDRRHGGPDLATAVADGYRIIGEQARTAGTNGRIRDSADFPRNAGTGPKFRRERMILPCGPRAELPDILECRTDSQELLLVRYAAKRLQACRYWPVLPGFKVVQFGCNSGAEPFSCLTRRDS